MFLDVLMQSRFAKLIWLSLLAFLIFTPAISAQTDPAIPSGDVRIHYHRPDGAYSGWALYTWNASTAGNTWCSSEINPTGTDVFRDLL